ncbi:MAG: hypothetical protein PHV06_06090 [bacterium]|nr:hypothetical protein [bacterium]
MENLKEIITYSLDNPEELEDLYRKNTDEFKSIISELYSESPDVPVLKFWYFRLNYIPKPEPSDGTEKVPSGGFISEGWLIAILIAISGLLLNLPSIFLKIDPELFYVRYSIPVSLGVLAVYLIYKLKPTKDIIIYQGIIFVMSILILHTINTETDSQTDVLAILHLPFLLWGFIQLNFINREIFNVDKGIGYLKLNGEAVVYIGVIAIAMQIFNLLVMALFSFLVDDFIEFYIKHILVFYIAGIILAGAALTLREIKAVKLIAPIISKIFSPMVLSVVVVFLVNYLFSKNNPFTDRDFLIIFNFILVIVLLIIIYALVERPDDSDWNLFDYFNSSLIFLTIIIDLIALSAIIFRLSWYGFTPNRITVLVMNILILSNLILLMYHYIKFFRKKTRIKSIKRDVVIFIPVYTAWTFIVVFIFPFILNDFPT